MPDTIEPLLDARDIQGNILPGFNRCQQLFAAFTATDAVSLRGALAGLPAPTSLEAVLRQRDRRKASLVQGMGRPCSEEFWFNLALSANATDLLGATGVRQLDHSFSLGMRYGDLSARELRKGVPNPSHPENWQIGSKSAPCDVMLIFAADSGVREQAAPLIAAFSERLGRDPDYLELGELLPGEIEHFGFRDGISQVGVIGKVEMDGAERDLTTRYGVPPRYGVAYGKPGQPMVWPGQFLTGQPTYPGEPVALAPELANGSFMVFSRLRQDVASFLSDTDALATSLATESAAPLSGPELRARIVGRQPGGQALMRTPAETGGTDGELAINHFGYGVEMPALTLDDGTTVAASQADPDVLRGLRCPAWAHIRKVNPRDLGTDKGDESKTIGMQMLRRGIPFGPLYDRERPGAPENAAERGLLFVAYQRHLDKQFAALTKDWMNKPNAPTAGGFDLLVGQHINGGLHAPKSATFHTPDGPGIAFKAERQWVIPTGGAFLFAPSLRFIEYFVHASAPGAAPSFGALAK